MEGATGNGVQFVVFQGSVRERDLWPCIDRLLNLHHKNLRKRCPNVAHRLAGDCDLGHIGLGALFERLIVLRGRRLLQRANITTAVILLGRELLPPERIPTNGFPRAGNRTVEAIIDRNNGPFQQRS